MSTPIIVLCGQAGSGKSTLGNYLAFHHGATCIAFADPIKRICQHFFDFTDEQLWGPSELRGKVDGRIRKEKDILPISINKELDDLSVGKDWHKWNTFLLWVRTCLKQQEQGLTPRYCLQTLGTEWGRFIDPNIWVNIALDTAFQLLENPSLTYSHNKGITPVDASNKDWYSGGIVITDGRFRNEILEVKKMGGIAVGIDKNQPFDPTKTHPSETELLKIPLHWFDYVIQNNQSTDMLRYKADLLIEKVWPRGESL